MGGRLVPKSSGFIGGGAVSRSATRQINKKIKEHAPEAAAEITMKTIATTNPTVAALYIAYRVGKFMYPIVKEGVKKYEKTGDSDKAVDKMKEETVKQVGREVKDAVIGAVVQTAYAGAISQANVRPNETINTLVTSAIEEVIKGAIK